MIQMRDVIFDKKMIFDEDIEAAKLDLKKAQTAQNMSLDQLAELLQWLNETETTRQSKSDKLILDNDTTTVMSETDDTDSDDHNSHDSHEDQLWNEESLKKYTLNTLNTLKFSYSTSSETLSALLTDVIYQILNKHDRDSHIMNFESWKTVFAAERLAQSEKLQTQQSQHQIEEKDSIIKENVKVIINTLQELKFFHQKIFC